MTRHSEVGEVLRLIYAGLHILLSKTSRVLALYFRFPEAGIGRSRFGLILPEVSSSDLTRCKLVLFTISVRGAKNVAALDRLLSIAIALKTI